MSKESLDYSILCPNYYSSWEDGCCMEGCEFYVRDECPITYVNGLLSEKDEKIKELEHRLSNCIEPKFKPKNDLFVIVGYKDEPKSIEQYYIDEIVIRGDGKLVEYRDIDKETIIGENNLLFATLEEAKAKLEELKNE